jgi:hypothetical protein
MFARAFAALVLLAAPNSSLADELLAGIETLYRLDRMAELRPSVKIGSISSYDRTGGNNDGFSGTYSFVRKEEGGLVLADLEGPGVIYRIWTPTPTDDVMEFYFDGESEPRISVTFREIFMGSHPSFERPLVGYGAGGFYSYMPLPYEKSCKVLIRAESIKFYQINFATYQEGAGVETFDPSPGPAQRERIEKAKSVFAAYGTDISEWVVPPGAEAKKVSKSITLEPGGSVTLFESKYPGRIAGIRLRPASALAGKQRDIVLRAFWDDESEPSINVPAGDFFGYSWGEPSMKSLLAGTADGEDYCYFPMPFDNSCRLELAAERTLDKPVGLEAEILYAPVPRRENEGKFYALWRRENPTTAGKPFTFIETEGRGHIVGVVQQAQGLETGRTRFFEGDDRTVVDGEQVIHGTGSEDFYNGGWYDVAGRWETRRSYPLSGCLAYKKHLGRTGGYRLFLGDAYSYGSSILQTIEHAPTNNDELNDYAGVTWFYSLQRPTCSFELPPVEQRIVSDPQRMVFAAFWTLPVHAFSLRNATLTKGVTEDSNRYFRYLSLRAEGEDEFGAHFITLTCELPAAGEYRISLDAVRGPDLGIVQLFLDEAPVGPSVDLYSLEQEEAKDVYVGNMMLEEGPNHLLFKIVGKNEKSSALGFDLTNIICELVK